MGNHNIVGALKDLERALHVVKRRGGAAGGGEGGDGGVAYEVLCVVRRKLVFTDRPQPVISAALAGGMGKPVTSRAPAPPRA